MRSFVVFMFLVTVFHIVQCVPHVDVSKNNGGGINFKISDDGYNMIGLHYSINNPIAGVAAGQYGADITTKTNGFWEYTNDGVSLNTGDIVYYWVLYLRNGQGHNLLDQRWTCCGETTTRTPTTAHAPIVTAKPHTNAPIQHTTGSPVNIGTPVVQQPVETNTGGQTSQPNVNAHVTKGPMTVTNQQQEVPQCSSYPCLVFEDEFEELNVDVWEHEITASGGGNWEFQYYINNRSNSYVRDGKLFIRPTLTADRFGAPFLATGKLDLYGIAANDICTGGIDFGCLRQGDGTHLINPIQSAKLRSIRGFNMKFGKLEIKAKLPSGDWIWPAMWLLPRYSRYGGWPASGEIDIMESRGNKNLVDRTGKQIGNNAFGSTLQFGPDYFNNAYLKAHKEKVLSSGTFADRFYTYTLEWDENGLRTLVDGEVVLDMQPDDGGFWKIGEFEKMKGVENPWRGAKTKMAPFDQEFYIILNVAVGGTGGYWEPGLAGMPWNNVGETATRDFWNARGQWHRTWNPDQNNGEDAALQIESIRYWKLKP